MPGPDASSAVHVFGIRHHGPGSARSLVAALDQLQPDCVLVEGPPDAAPVLPLAAHAALQPPVALLLYDPEAPRRAVYYPFAAFSPEWNAIRWGLARGVPVRFMDLPIAHQLGLPGPAAAADAAPPPPPPDLRTDPLAGLAEAAGYSDSERWWEHMVEHRRDGADLFQAVLEAMAALRAEAPPPSDPREAEREALREAWMRQTVRAARKEGCARVAVVCGAWHAPALANLPPAKEDAALLRGLPKSKVVATWVPWTHGRLGWWSGYGAGVASPGWYHHLWTHPERPAVGWLARVARLLRSEDLDASSAHVIEAVRLAESLAALRDRPLPGLPELTEATRAVLCFGSDEPLQLIEARLVIGETLGRVPEETPLVPLQHDLQREQKRLRLAPEATQREIDLDLRKPTDLARSQLLHRLHLLGVRWGELQRVGSGKTGTFHEPWRLQWQPELAVALIEAGVWGNTLAAAATAYVRHAADTAPDLPALTRLVDAALLADLPDAVDHLMARLQESAALASDVGHLMDALPPLVQVLRYGDVRRTEAPLVAGVVDGLVTRVCIGLPGACATLDDAAAEQTLARLEAVHGAVALLPADDHGARWQAVLARLADLDGLHGLLAGRCVRLLHDAGSLDAAETSRRMGLALSPSAEPARAAAWVEGFLRGSGLLLLHDEGLWAALDGWVAALPAEAFPQLLPLLRRTFALFPAPERRNMGERARRTPARSGAEPGDADSGFDGARAAAVLPLLARLLGVDGRVDGR